MKTRFDSRETWDTGHKGKVLIENMSTDHLINTMRFLIRNSSAVVSMIVRDIEQGYDIPLWRADGEDMADAKAMSLYNITSLDYDEVRDYVMQTPLFDALVMEMEARGVDVVNQIDLVLEENETRSYRHGGKKL